MSNTFKADSQYALVLGDLGPPLAVQLMTSSNGAAAVPFVLQDADAVTLRYLDPNGAEHTVTMTIVDAATGQVSYSWQSGDLPISSTKLYTAQIRVVRSGEDFPQTFPDSGHLTWLVNPAIDGSAPGPFGTLSLVPSILFVAQGGEQDFDVALTTTMADTSYTVLPPEWAGGTSNGTLGSGVQPVQTPDGDKTTTSFRVVLGQSLAAGDRLRFTVLGRVLG